MHMWYSSIKCLQDTYEAVEKCIESNDKCQFVTLDSKFDRYGKTAFK